MLLSFASLVYMVSASLLVVEAAVLGAVFFPILYVHAVGVQQQNLLHESVSMEQPSAPTEVPERDFEERFANAVADIDRLESLGLAEFGREKYFEVKPLSALIRKQDVALLVPRGESEAAIRNEIEALLRPKNGESPTRIFVLLDERRAALRPLFEPLVNGQVQFITESEAGSAAFIENELVSPARDGGGRLKVLVYPQQRPSDVVLRALLDVARRFEDQNLVQFVLLNVLSADVLAIQAGWRAVEKWFDSQRLSGTQA
jgi:hypothetical protein